ncbi:MAG TPA: cytidylate kinase-like family protein [Anaerolineae bacterium]
MATITISREYGSGGDEVAARVSEVLGYHYFDKTLMAQLVKETGLAEDEVVDFSEDNYKVRGLLDKLFAPRGGRELYNVSQGSGVTQGARIRETAIQNESQGITLVQGVIWAAYKQGNMVIVGRGGQAILKGLPGVLHVRILAPPESRFEHITATENLHHFGLRKEIVEHDEAAADYLKRFYNIDWADPMLYDLVINTEHLSVEAATDIIVAAVKYLPVPEPVRKVAV